ncbi:STAS domain-containing protein [Saccharothrix yanglingensis]|uniref:Anti-sigma factor antagonist n=1 Tax=Saccharothrix yanglingensis TaxID=659496 RepID=A0ABU0X0E0_9PSEU|nr:STAS domain-containing protein [Saccharothrix yanglingensis]MDQ2585062.1 anti-anti-sigma factor [Saccharothrix yanglingensis]
MSGLRVTTRQLEDFHVVALDGELDLGTTARLRDAVGGLVLRAGDHVVVDLTAVTFCDSTGVSALIAARRHADAAGCPLVLAGTPPHITRLLRVVGLLPVFPAHSTVEEATRAPIPPVP